MAQRVGGFVERSDMTMAESSGAEASRKARRVLIVEDELDQQELLRFNFRRAGYSVSAASDGPTALALAEEEPPDAVVLDLMLPGMDGVSVCRKLREAASASAGVVMLTAKSEESDVVRGLEAGADDYVTKPYSPRVLLARVGAVLRNKGAGSAGGDDGSEGSAIRHGELVIRPDRFEATVGERAVKLSSTEFRILSLLAGRPGYVFSRERIIELVHGGHCAVTNRSVDVHVFWLRQKLGICGRRIEAVRGVGYRFRAGG